MATNRFAYAGDDIVDVHERLQWPTLSLARKIEYHDNKGRQMHIRRFHAARYKIPGCFAYNPNVSETGASGGGDGGAGHGESEQHLHAKFLLKKMVGRYKFLVSRCRCCSNHDQWEMGEKVSEVVIEKRHEGFAYDVAYMRNGAVSVALEVWHTHQTGKRKRDDTRSAGVAFAEFDVEDVLSMADNHSVNLLHNLQVHEFACPECKAMESVQLAGDSVPDQDMEDTMLQQHSQQTTQQSTPNQDTANQLQQPLEKHKEILQYTTIQQHKEEAADDDVVNQPKQIQDALQHQPPPAEDVEIVCDHACNAWLLETHVGLETSIIALQAKIITRAYHAISAQTDPDDAGAGLARFDLLREYRFAVKGADTVYQTHRFRNLRHDLQCGVDTRRFCQVADVKLFVALLIQQWQDISRMEQARKQTQRLLPVVATGASSGVSPSRQPTAPSLPSATTDCFQCRCKNWFLRKHGKFYPLDDFAEQQRIARDGVKIRSMPRRIYCLLCPSCIGSCPACARLMLLEDCVREGLCAWCKPCLEADLVVAQKQYRNTQCSTYVRRQIDILYGSELYDPGLARIREVIGQRKATQAEKQRARAAERAREKSDTARLWQQQRAERGSGKDLQLSRVANSSQARLVWTRR